jgi:hypothetical protein
LVYVHPCDGRRVRIKKCHVESEPPTFHENRPAEPESITVVISATSSEGAIGRKIAANDLDRCVRAIHVESSTRQGRATDKGALEEDCARGPADAHAAAKSGARHVDSNECGFDTTTEYTMRNCQNSRRAIHEDRTTAKIIRRYISPRELEE